MLKFQEFYDFINEKLMIFGRRAYPKFGNVVILAGGAGSGKGFQLERLLGIDGKVFDVDALKEMAMKSDLLAKRIKDETGQDIKNFDLKNPDNVSKLHEILAGIYNLPNRRQKALFSSILASDPSRKPNLIFDVTMKDLGKLESISRNVTQLGYDKRNVHLVWVVNDFNVAIEQNQGRPRVVPEEILMATHEGAALTMKKVLSMGNKLRKYMDGVIYISFNKKKVDTKMAVSDRGGSYIKEADYIKVKEQGRSQMKPNELSDDILAKIKDYVPKTDVW